MDAMETGPGAPGVDTLAADESPKGGAPMSHAVTRLLNRPLTADGSICRLFRAAGVHDFPGASLST